jgi:alanine dehydrogenase
MLLLSEADVRRLLPINALIEEMERALMRFSRGAVVQPVRTVLEIGPARAFYGVMPAWISDPPALGTKLVTVYHSNVERGLPSHLATIVLMDPETGQLLAVMDGRYITEARTAAVSAVSARHLADPDAATLAILGSGVQARSHLEALRCVVSVGHVRVWSPNAERRTRYAEDMRAATGLVIEAVETPEKAVSDARLIVLVTASRVPVLHASVVTPGAHIMAVGACRPDQREMDSDLVSRARVFVDSRAGALVEAGDIVLPIAEGRITPAHVIGELGEVVAGDVEGRTSREEVTIFKSLGMAVEDVAAAQLVYRRAVDEGVGTQI